MLTEAVSPQGSRELEPGPPTPNAQGFNKCPEGFSSLSQTQASPTPCTQSQCPYAAPLMYSSPASQAGLSRRARPEAGIQPCTDRNRPGSLHSAELGLGSWPLRSQVAALSCGLHGDQAHESPGPSTQVPGPRGLVMHLSSSLQLPWGISRPSCSSQAGSLLNPWNVTENPCAPWAPDGPQLGWDPNRSGRPGLPMWLRWASRA